jgi:hypothetical protein
MPQIMLTEEQAKQVAEAREPIQVCDARGNVLGYVSPLWTEEEIADARRRLASDEPRYTTAQMLDHLRSLERP